MDDNEELVSVLKQLIELFPEKFIIGKKKKNNNINSNKHIDTINNCSFYEKINVGNNNNKLEKNAQFLNRKRLMNNTIEQYFSKDKKKKISDKSKDLNNKSTKKEIIKKDILGNKNIHINK